MLLMARVDYHLHRQEFDRAAYELGQVPKEFQDTALFQIYSQRVLSALYSTQARKRKSALSSTPRIHERLRVVRRKHDASRGSDQTFDNRGWAIGQHLEAHTDLVSNIKGRFVLDLEGFRNGHNDLRYRTLLADFSRDNAHLALGDIASFPGEHFLRGSRFRGVHLSLDAGVHQWQALAGGYPFWLEDRDAYIYPRTVWGVRDRVKLFEDRFHFALGLIQTRDSEKIRTIDPINRPRDNVVLSFDQMWKVIPDVWWVRASEAYSWTDDNLLTDRFGDNTKLKDTSFLVESTVLKPWVRWDASFQRVGPDFRIHTDIPSGSVVNVKAFTSDRQLIEHRLDFRPMGPLDLDLKASWMRNDLDRDETVEQTREGWYTMDLGILTPSHWPRPRFRATWIDTTSSPGSTTRPGQVRTLKFRHETLHTLGKWDLTGFAEYETERPMQDKDRFDEEERWSIGTRLGIPWMERILVSPYYRYVHFDEVFNETRSQGIRHEAGLSNSIRLWSTASLSLGYDFIHGKRNRPAGDALAHIEAHTGTLNFSWPYTHYSADRRKKWTLSPWFTFYLAHTDQDLEHRPLLATRLTAGYEVFQNWKVELSGEFRYDKDEKDENALTDIRTEESRLWLTWTSQWR